MEARWKEHTHEHKRDTDRYLYRAMRKHGISNFSMVMLEDTASCDANDRECFWIAELSPEYNMTSGGEGGWIHDQTGNTWKVRDSSRMGQGSKGKKQSIARKAMISSGNNYQSQFLIHTPWGVFETYKNALIQAKKLRALGRHGVITDRATLKKYCESDILLRKDGRRTFAAWRGKSSTQLGFFKEPKNNV